jgi:capsule polysaccharide export protein KpsC/LpsZ
VLYQQPNGQLQIQHKQNKNNNKKDEVLITRYFSKDKFQLVVTQDINNNPWRYSSDEPWPATKIIERNNNNNNNNSIQFFILTC